MNIKLFASLKTIKELTVYIKDIKTVKGKPFNFFHFSIMGHQNDKALYFRLIVDVDTSKIKVFDSDGIIVNDDKSDSYKLFNEESTTVAQSFLIPTLVNSGLIKNMLEGFAQEGEVYTISMDTTEIRRIVKK